MRRKASRDSDGMELLKSGCDGRGDGDLARRAGLAAASVVSVAVVVFCRGGFATGGSEGSAHTSGIGAAADRFPTNPLAHPPVA